MSRVTRRRKNSEKLETEPSTRTSVVGCEDEGWEDEGWEDEGWGDEGKT